MPLQHTPHLIGNDFEGAGVRDMSRSDEDGFTAHNIWLPKVNDGYNPN
ncbi:MAG: hypothetical protein KME26_06490 [Oscillatoria princeps RMCB-10]|jgi:hypothetical protein|nr:hypothetical protein [Oscillatoria princeps RMCB-10]